MGKLYFRYGVMGSSKTANALMVRYNYMERGKKVVLLKPQLETRDGDHQIQSRIGLSAPCDTVEEFMSRVREGESEAWEELSAVIVDDSQFMTAEQVEFLADFADAYGAAVICYGLLIDFQGKLFEGSRRLTELSDVIEEVPSICWCGKKAHFNARIQNGKIIYTGAQIMMGGNEAYTALCRKHYREGIIRRPDWEESADD